MANFIAMVYATLGEKGIDTSKLSPKEAVEKYNELMQKQGNKDPREKAFVIKNLLISKLLRIK